MLCLCLDLHSLHLPVKDCERLILLQEAAADQIQVSNISKVMETRRALDLPDKAYETWELLKESPVNQNEVSTISGVTKMICLN